LENEYTLATFKVMRGLTKSRVYRFTYRVMNINGWSPLADIVYIRAAIVPSKTDPPRLIAATSSTMDL
jgi:hypothetical protein